MTWAAVLAAPVLGAWAVIRAIGDCQLREGVVMSIGPLCTVGISEYILLVFVSLAPLAAVSLGIWTASREGRRRAFYLGCSLALVIPITVAPALG